MKSDGDGFTTRYPNFIGSHSKKITFPEKPKKKLMNKEKFPNNKPISDSLIFIILHFF